MEHAGNNFTYSIQKVLFRIHINQKLCDASSGSEDNALARGPKPDQRYSSVLAMPS